MKAERTVANASPGDGWRQLAVPLVLVLLVVAAALAVVQSTHDCRQLYARLQVLESHRWQLDEEYGRLLLEQSTWAAHHRVERVATDELGMSPPALDDLRVIAP